MLSSFPPPLPHMQDSNGPVNSCDSHSVVDRQALRGRVQRYERWLPSDRNHKSVCSIGVQLLVCDSSRGSDQGNKEPI